MEDPCRSCKPTRVRWPGRLDVHGDVWLGSSPENEIIFRGELLVQNEAGETQFSVDPGTGDTYAAGSCAATRLYSCNVPVENPLMQL